MKKYTLIISMIFMLVPVHSAFAEIVNASYSVQELIYTYVEPTAVDTYGIGIHDFDLNTDVTASYSYDNDISNATSVYVGPTDTSYVFIGSPYGSILNVNGIDVLISSRLEVSVMNDTMIVPPGGIPQYLLDAGVPQITEPGDAIWLGGYSEDYVYPPVENGLMFFVQLMDLSSNWLSDELIPALAPDENSLDLSILSIQQYENGNLVFEAFAIVKNNIPTATDTDGDGVNDSSDNCIQVKNPLQRDTDADGYGNYCDPDFNNDLIVGAADLAYFKPQFFTADPDADLNGDGSVNGGDLAILKGFFFQPPGPSYIDTATTETGILFDSPVSGVNYNTATQSGVTDAQGNYSYLPGETVTFSIGDLTFPPAKAVEVVTPLDMVGKTDLTDTSVINITRLLQSLDVDGDPFNGIEISTAAHTAATELTVDFQSSTFDTDVANLVANSGSITTTLIDQTTAIDNFKLALSTLPIDWESYYNYADNRQWNYTVDLSWISTFYDYTVNSNINGEDVYIHGWDPIWDPDITKEYILRDMSSGVSLIGIQINGVDEFFPEPINIRCSNLYESCNRSGLLGEVDYDMTLYSELATITLTSGTIYNDCIKTTEEDNLNGQVRHSWQCRDVGEVKGEKVGDFISELESIGPYEPTWYPTSGPVGCQYQYDGSAPQADRCQLQTGNQCEITNLLISPADTGTLYAGTFCNGVYKSTDNGKSWSAANNGLVLGLDTYILSMDPSNPQSLYMGTVGAGVFKSENGGDNWNPINNGITDLRVHSAPAINPMYPSILYIGTEGPVFISLNSGASWSEANAGLEAVEVSDLAIDPVNTFTIYAGLHYSEGSEGGVFKSTDGGQNWFSINNGLPSTTSSVYTLTIDPTNNQIIYATTDSGVYKTTDGGQNWSQINNGLTSSPHVYLIIHPSNPDVLYVGTIGSGVFTSSDGGANWQPFNTGLTNLDVIGMALDPVSQYVLYAGTIGDGVFKYYLP